VTVAVAQAEMRRPWAVWHGLWLAAILATLAFYLLRDVLPWTDTYPRAWLVPLSAWTNIIMGWVIDTFFTITRTITAILNLPLQTAYALLDRGFTFGDGESAINIPPLSWLGVTATVTLIGYAYGGWRLALLSGIGFLYFALFGQWSSAMRTLALVVISVPLGVILGLFIGILGYKRPLMNKAAIVPLLDIAQATPQYAYLVPMLMLFGNNPVSAMIATLTFAVPPMVRATTLALSQVPSEVRDFGHMAGCTRRQHLWRILIPSARPLLMVGVNQVINMTLNMVIISSMIGAGGLGYDVLLALRQLKVGTAFEAGIAIVLLAIVLDRLSQAAASRKPALLIPGQPLWYRHRIAVLALAILGASSLIGVFVPILTTLPKSATITTAALWDGMIKWLVVNLFDYIEAGRTWLLLNVLKPFKNFLLALPWLGVVLLLGLAGLQLGRHRLAILVVSLALFCAVSGLWEVTITTVYLVGISSALACVIGIPLGILGARNDAAHRVLSILVDTLQTIPAFVYLIPAVMLFRVGDVAAMIGIILYAITPAIRYTDHGIRQVSPGLIEAGKVSGCTRRQLLWRVQIPLALPEIMLGINQVVFLALSMDIIAAMIGTSDLGQEVFKALAKADAGRGIIGGLAVACIGIIADRLISAWSQRVKDRFGIA
jgi:glycine betaine/proline transport system permease protein